MPEAQDIGQMMQTFAGEAVRIARSYKIELDYSEDSLQQVESLLERSDERLPRGLGSESSAGAQDEKSADRLAKIWGAYLGEVVRRRFGGEWAIERYPAGNFLIVTLNVNGAKIFPSMKIHKRLTEGSQENIWEFYRAMREKLISQPGALVQ